MTRRDALMMMGSGFGMTGLAGMLAGSTSAAPTGPHFKPRTKHVIFLFLNGGPSQVETFDPKPMLDKFHGTAEPGWEKGFVAAGHIVHTGSLRNSPSTFKKTR